MGRNARPNKEGKSVRLTKESLAQLAEIIQLTGRSEGTVLEFAIENYYRIVKNIDESRKAEDSKEIEKNHG